MGLTRHDDQRDGNGVDEGATEELWPSTPTDELAEIDFSDLEKLLEGNNASNRNVLDSSSLEDFTDDFNFDDFAEEQETTASAKILDAISTLNIKDMDGVVTAEDFEEGPPRQAFQIIMHYATALLPELMYPTKRPKNIVYSHERVMKAIRFLFGREEHEEKNKSGINFALCCETIGEYVRPDVIRLRFHYEFWLRQLRFQEEFPFLIDSVPAFIENHAYFLNGKSAAILCDLMWSQPGLHIDDLLNRGIDMEPDIPLKEWKKSLAMLDEEFIASDFIDYWYLTGKNPVRSHQEHIASGKRVSNKYGRLNWSGYFGSRA